MKKNTLPEALFILKSDKNTINFEKINKFIKAGKIAVSK